MLKPKWRKLLLLAGLALFVSLALSCKWQISHYCGESPHYRNVIGVYECDGSEEGGPQFHCTRLWRLSPFESYFLSGEAICENVIKKTEPESVSVTTMFWTLL